MPAHAPSLTRARANGTADTARRNGRKTEDGSAGLHSKILATSLPRRVTPDEIRADPAYDADVEQFLRDVDRKLVPYMRQAVALIPDVATLKDGVATQIHTGGKRIRAALCVSSCELFGAPNRRALPYAAAIEHLQNFSLIHDDIADGDLERRSRPAIWKQYGIGHAINIGDVFIPIGSLSVLSAPYSAELKLRLLETIARFGLQMSVGQSMDINLRTRETVSVDDYIECTRLKTGAFLAMAVVGGAIIGGAQQQHIDLLSKYASSAGVAFQIKDDSLDLTGGKGRQIGSDIVEGKITLHAVYALSHASPPERIRLRRILLKRPQATRRQDVEWVVRLYGRLGALAYAEATSARMIESAARMLLQLPESPYRERLIHVSRYLNRRVR